MFRDDHDAALTRIDALEAELARERSDDAAQAARIEKLEVQLAQAKAKLGHTEDELDRYRPKPAPQPESDPAARAAVLAASEPVQMENPTGSGRGAAIFVSGLLIAVLVVGFVLMATSHSDTQGPQPIGEQR